MNALEPTMHPPATELSPRGAVARESVSPAREDQLTRRLRQAFRLLAVVLCCLHAYANRHLINPDGLSYLDLATGDGAPNGYWSPLYPWLLGLALRISGATPFMECAVAHAVNVGLFLVSLVAFEWLLREILRVARAARARESWDTPLPDWAITGLGYAIFTYTARRLVTVSLVTPDMLVAAAVYAGCALLLRMRRGPGCWRNPLLLGLVLGVGFLGKAVLFPLALVMLALTLVSGTLRQAAMRFGLALGAFAVVASIVIVPLSRDRGKLTYGESGRLNYLWYVLKTPRPDRLASPTTLDETGLVVTLPTTAGTYPLWLDPSLSFVDATPRLALRAQLTASVGVALFYYELLSQKMVAFTAVLLVVVAFSFFARHDNALAWLRQSAGALMAMFCCAVPSLAGLGIYLLVGHAEERLVGPFLVLLALCLLSAVRLSRARAGAARPLAGSLLAFLGMLFAGNLLFDLGNAFSAARAGEGWAAHPHAAVAEELRLQGVERGEAVGSIGFTYNAYWARLAGTPVRAEVPEHLAGRFWRTSATEQQRTWQAFRRAGIRVVVSDVLPPEVGGGWRRIAGTTFAYRRLVP